MSVTASPIRVVVRKYPQLHDIMRAWEFSRPNETNIDEMAVAATDVPVHEFTHFILEMHVPILLREWLASWREHVMWARTSRVDNLDDWPILPGCENSVRLNYEKMQQQKALHQDRFRLNLPLCYMTNLSMCISLRLFAKIIRSCEYEVMSGYPPGVTKMFIDFRDKLIGIYRLTHEWAFLDKLIETTPGTSPLNREPTSLNPVATSIGEMVFCSASNVSLALRAQMVRHRPLTIVDDLWFRMQDDAFLMKSIDTEVDVDFSCTKKVARSIVEKRNCWIAQEDIWRPVVQLLNSVLGENDVPPLPCDNGRPCIAQRDNELRVWEKDPSPPCPIWMRRKQQEVHAKVIGAMQGYASQMKPTNKFFWEKQIFYAMMETI